jgi:hypothetical protein
MRDDGGKRTATLEEALLESITVGLSLSKACSLVGITSESFAEWREKDPELAQRVEQAHVKRDPTCASGIAGTSHAG